MSFDSIIAEQNKMKATVKEWQTKFREDGKKLFNEQTKKIFEMFPDLGSFGWNQYTPFFNDGEACEFSVNHYSIDINGQDSDEYKKGSPEKEMGTAISKWLGAFDDDLMKYIFGDHVKITVNRDGTNEIEDYSDHD